MSKPIRPSEVTKVKAATLPNEVFDAFNECITAAWSGHSAKVMQADAAKAIVAKFKAAGKTLTRSQVFDEGYLDVEDAYRAAGWKVEYDKPGYCENYAAYFVFSK